MNLWGENAIYEGRQEKEKILSAYRGTLTPVYPIDLSQPFIISIGTIYTSYSVEEVAKGIDLAKFIHVEINNETVSFPVSLSFEDGLIHVFAEVKDKNNDTIGTIVDNDWWSANPQNTASVYRRNYNSYAFELIDGNKIPVLQISMSQQNKIEIGFSLFSQGIPYYFGITTGKLIGVSSEDLKQIRSETLFKYPSEDHIGEMMNSNGTSTNVLDDANLKVQFGNTLVIVGRVAMVILESVLRGLLLTGLQRD